jgi:hypothetical protein
MHCLRRRPGGNERWPISSVILLAVVLGACGPAQFDGKEGFSDEIGDETATGTDTATDTTDTTETSEECPELVQTGSVSLNSPEVLQQIAGVTKIDGNVEITGQLGSLAGLECLQEVTGYVYAHHHDLIDLAQLERLSAIGNYLYLGQSDTLLDLHGLESLRQIGGYLHVTENFALTSLDGLDDLVLLDGFLIISHNPQLSNIDALASLPGTYDQLGIENNPSLTNLDGLSGMIGLGGSLRIVDNVSLSDASGLAGVQSIAGNVLIQNNPGLSDLGLWSTKTVDGFMVLSAMPSLISLDSLINVYGIDGPLYVHGTGVTNFDGLSSLVWLGGDLWVQDNFQLFQIDGLLGLTEIHGMARIDLNPQLVSTAGLGQVQTISNGLSLWGNPQLEVLGMNSLQSVGDFVRIGFTSNLSGLGPSQLQVVAGDFLIWNNEALVEIDGLSNLQTVGGRLYLRENPALSNVAGLESLSEVFGRLQIIDNDSLANLNGLGSLQIAAEVNVTGNFLLANIAGLSNLQELPGDLRVIQNEALSNLGGLNQLAQVGGNLRIQNNSNLEAIPGLQTLTAVGGNVEITNNTDLPTCVAQELVDQLAAVGGGVEVSGNKTDACGG